MTIGWHHSGELTRVAKAYYKKVRWGLGWRRYQRGGVCRVAFKTFVSWPIDPRTSAPRKTEQPLVLLSQNRSI